jgi:hypothetical protein
VKAVEVAMPNALDLDPELGDAIFVCDIEEVFGVRLTQADVGTWLTVGDAYNTLCTCLDDQLGRDGACMDAMAFYRLRRALIPLVRGARMSPSMPLQGIGGLSVRKLFRYLARETGLKIPQRGRSWIGEIGLALFAIAPILWFVTSAWPTLLAALAVGILMVRIDPGALPSDCSSLGELARRVAVLNHGRLHASGARSRPDDVWKTLVDIASRISTLPREQIQRDTYLLAQ